MPETTTIDKALLVRFKNKSLPRGIRNNNPGNIEYMAANNWLGQLSPTSIRALDAGAVDSRFAQFVLPEYGIRAMLCVFTVYQSKYNKRTVRELVTRWAPPSENDTEAYIKSASLSAGISADSVVNFKLPAVAIGFAKAIVAHETGMGSYYPQTIYQKAYSLM